MLNHFRAILHCGKVTPCVFLAVGSSLALSSDAAEVKTKSTALVSVAISQIALMTLNDHVAAYGVVEPGGPTADQSSADPVQLVVKGYVPVDDAANLKLGRPVEISTALANSKVLGALLSISPVVDERTGGVMVRASVPKASGFRPGQFVKLRIATEEHANILAVPVESLVKDPDVGYVIAFIEGDQATQHPVRVGIRDGDFVEVEGEGVKVGLTVAAEGAYALPKQSKVHVITPVD